MASKQQPHKQDVDVLDCWEQFDEETEARLRQLPIGNKTRQPDSISCNGTTTTTTGSAAPTPMKITLMGEEALRSQYVPPEPTVKILRRPTKEPLVSQESRTYQPKKSLQQREQEYAEARARILGENHCDKPTAEDRVSSIQNKRVSELENIIRLPKGPDSNGNKGFQLKR